MHPSGLEALAARAVISPFSRLRLLLDGVAPAVGLRPIELTVGEPRETMPAFVADKLKEAEALFAKYPPIRGSAELRGAIADWLVRRYGKGAAADPETEILPLNGSREGLFYAAFQAVGAKRGKLAAGLRPAILMPNPYYQAYYGAALATEAEPVALPATAATGHLPDLEAIVADPALLARTAAFYLCSPANPQGAVATRDYIARALALARAHDFPLFFDECYSEIYSGEPPPGGLEVAATTPDRFKSIVVFNSLSKRSNLPGLRSGFCAGDRAFIDTFAEVRNLVGPTMPGPVQHASAAVWSEEQHVAANRLAYKMKYDVCDAVLGARLGYQRPAGGFFLWLDMGQLGGGETATVTLWKRCAVKVVPGAYLAHAGADGVNPGDEYVRVALVATPAVIREALQRIVAILA
jgi:N-succinyldiaminopimelate aminotransferase